MKTIEWSVESFRVEDEQGIQVLKKAGAKFNNLPAAEVQKWQKAIEPLVSDYIAALQAKGMYFDLPAYGIHIFEVTEAHK